jgi:hypothetical protein
MSGNRSRDLDANRRTKIIQQLTTAKVTDSWIDMVASVKELNEAETKRVFGEGLPVGLKLIQ